MSLSLSSRAKFRTPLDFVARRDARLVCSFDTMLTTETEEDLPVRVFNFSERGFMLATSSRLKSGARVALKLHGIGDKAARILWCRDMQAGGSFEERVDTDLLVKELEERELV